ncbi:unnamed protein product [Alternaria alternata]
MDGYDRIQYSKQCELQHNFRQLQSQGLRVLLFSAVSKLDVFPPAWPVECDKCGRGREEKDGLYIYWACDLCPCDLCDMCKTAGIHCDDRQHQMSEPYDVVNMRLVTVPSELESFVRADLTAEYGSELNDDVVEAVCEPSDGNTNLAKLRLDQIRDLDSPSDILSPTDRLPREVVAFFDAEIKLINILESSQRYQTLLALIAIAAAGDWMSVIRLEELLSHVSGSDTVCSDGSYPQVRRILSSAHGLLSSLIFFGNLSPGHEESDRHRIGLYTRDLGWYIREDYNQDLVLAKRYLSEANIGERNLDRSYSFEKTVGERKQDIGEPNDTLYGVWRSKSKLHEISGNSVIDSILREPEGICTPCQESIFLPKSNSGVRTWSNYDQNRDRKTYCQFCCYAYNEMDDTGTSMLAFHWTRRTMGRTSNSNDHMVVALRYTGFSAQTLFRRFVFMLKSELRFLPAPDRLGETTTLKHTGKQIQKWLETCQTEHTHCNYKKVKPYVPKRLVDIDTGASDRLRVIGKEEKEEGPYVTLSHSWGRNPNFLTLTTKDKDRLMKQDFSITELRNKNFEQAIEIARHLKVKYIWIDSLCICQAGRDKDFREEGQYMHLVYQNSFCNIVAADSKDGQGGLFRNRSIETLPGTDTQGSWVVLDKELWAKQLLQSPIYTRGWVFQERMLSPRIIHFTRSQVFWDCSTVSACETLPDGLPFPLSAIATTDRRWRGRLQRKNSEQDRSNLAVEDSLEKFWKSAVLNYTSCDLTNQADKTFAIWSVAKLVRDNLPDQYGCGLWSVALHEQLAWQVKVAKHGARMDVLQSGFPSWSWASVNAPILVQDRIVAKRCYTVKNHKGAALSFSDFKDKALISDMQPQFAASDSLAVRGHLICGRLGRSARDETHTFQSVEAGSSQKYEVITDEKLPEALLSSCFYLMPLVARKTSDSEIAYTGSALVLTATDDYRQLTHMRLTKQLLNLVSSSQPHPDKDTPHADRKSELQMLRRSVDALNACLHKIAKQDRELPLREGNAFRRVGVVQFHDLPAKEWACIRAKEERLIWLD